MVGERFGIRFIEVTNPENRVQKLWYTKNWQKITIKVLNLNKNRFGIFLASLY
jgi:hypothetical protein